MNRNESSEPPRRSTAKTRIRINATEVDRVINGKASKKNLVMSIIESYEREDQAKKDNVEQLRELIRTAEDKSKLGGHDRSRKSSISNRATINLPESKSKSKLGRSPQVYYGTHRRQQSAVEFVTPSHLQKVAEESHEPILKAESKPKQQAEIFTELLKYSSNLAQATDSSRKQEPFGGYFKDYEIKISFDFTEDTVHRNRQEHQITSYWLGQVFEKCTSSAFKLYIRGDLDYNETKTYCCQQILSNIIEAAREENHDKVRRMPSLKSLSSLESDTREPRRKPRINYEKQPMKFINDESNKILAHLCNKYPQTDIQGVNKIVDELARGMKIDNWADDEYDLVRLSDVIFEYKEEGDYSKEIMQFLNFLIELPYKKHAKYERLSNYKYFEAVMNKIFEVVYHKDSKNDLGSVINEWGEIDLEPKGKGSQTEEEVEYREKVKGYTTVLIGCKIPSNSKKFSGEDIRSGIIKVENNQIARVIDKWADELSSKFTEAEKNILNRIYRFKSASDRMLNKLSDENRQELYKVLLDKRNQLDKFTNELKDGLYDLSNKLVRSDGSDVSELYFLSEREKTIGEFAVKMAHSSSEYFIQIIQKEIALLTESVEKLKKNWVAKYKYKEAPAYERLNISLITFKLGDLMRCKITSNESEIIRVLQVFVSLSEMWDSSLIKIIRIKNRLETGTRDILINFMFDNICPCEMQLAVVEKVSEKQIYFDKFNHFLYELKRAYLGPIMEMCKIWNQYESRAETFAKQITKSTLRKIKAKKVSPEFMQIDVNKTVIYRHRFPFVCQSCNIFCPRNSLIYFNGCMDGKLYCGNCTRVKMELTGTDALKLVKKQYVLGKYILRYPNFSKLVEHLFEINKMETAARQKFQIHIPINSQIVHLGFTMLIKLDRQDLNSDYDEFAYVSTEFKSDGTLFHDICSQKIAKPHVTRPNKGVTKLSQFEQSLLWDYIFYGWDLPTHLMPLPATSENCYLEMIQKFMPYLRKLQEEKGHHNVKVGAVELPDKKYYFFPFFVIDQIKMSDQLIQKSNLDMILSTLRRKEEIVEITNKKLTTEWSELSQSNRLQVAHTIKEIYLDRNLMKNIDFIQHFHVLKIMHAAGNQIERIPLIPTCLEDLKLEDNRLESINPFISTDSNDYALRYLNLAFNKISRIENIAELKKLERLYIYRNKIKKIEGLPASLKMAGLMWNEIEKLENLEHLVELTNLSISSNLITRIENLDACRSLTTLMLVGNKIEKIDNLNDLVNLNVLHLSSTGLDSQLVDEGSLAYYDGLRNLKKLKRLVMESNKIRCLIHIIGYLRPDPTSEQASVDCNNPYIELEELNLSNNEIEQIAHFEDVLPMVSMLNLHHNRISNVDNILNLNLLTELNLSFNLIEVLPQQGWEKIFKIKCMCLSNNLIVRVPDLRPLMFIRELLLESNRIRSVGGFPSYPLGYPDFTRKISLSHNLLFDGATDEQSLEITLQAMAEISEGSEVDLLDNGQDVFKLAQALDCRQYYGLNKIIIQQINQD